MNTDGHISEQKGYFTDSDNTKAIYYSVADTFAASTNSFNIHLHSLPNSA